MTDRIIFANTLRGFAAISVLLSHFAGIFWVMNPLICHLMGAPKLEHLPSLPAVLSFFADHCIILGQFGVGIFFIVSGFVIPFSLTSSSKKNFLFRRALRIYPVYIAGFSFVMVMLYVLSLYKNAPYNFSLFDIVAHFGVITRAPLDVVRIDGISWTLEVEIYFYLILCALGAKWVEFNFKRYIVAVFVIAIAATLAFKIKDYLFGVQIASGLMLLLGMTYYSLIHGKVTQRQFWTLQILICLLIPVLWLLVATRANYTYQWMSGYLIAIAVFYICYRLRGHFTENRLLSHLADISYPLYVVHALFGYGVMYVLIELGAGPVSAIVGASLASYLAAVLIHLTIEKPSLRWSKLRRPHPVPASST